MMQAMSLGIRFACFLVAAALGAAPQSRADGTITIHIANDSPDNLVVTLYDRNVRRHPLVLSSQIIYGNASIATSVTANAPSQGHVFWRVMTTDRDMPRCGHRELSHVDDGSTVRVSADSACPRRR
jgi:hypothetical protein